VRIEAKPPSIPLFAWVPMFTGNHWTWLERVDLVYSLMFGIPYWSLRLPPELPSRKAIGFR